MVVAVRHEQPHRLVEGGDVPLRAVLIDEPRTSVIPQPLGQHRRRDLLRRHEPVPEERWQRT